MYGKGKKTDKGRWSVVQPCREILSLCKVGALSEEGKYVIRSEIRLWNNNEGVVIVSVIF